jgi:hypothetical protein
MLLALEAHRRSPVPETEQAVLNALGSSRIPKNRLALAHAAISTRRLVM